MHNCSMSGWRRMVFAHARTFKTGSTDPKFLSDIVAGDEIWIYWCDPQTMQQLSQWNSPIMFTPKQGKTRLLKCEQHAHAFIWHLWSLCIMNLFPQGLTEPICLHLHIMASAGRCMVKMTWKVKFRDWLLHHKNISAHSFSVHEFLD
jgi:hypothetical protein